VTLSNLAKYSMTLEASRGLSATVDLVIFRQKKDNVKLVEQFSMRGIRFGGRKTVLYYFYRASAH